jgi:hypothetical protein
MKYYFLKIFFKEIVFNFKVQTLLAQLKTVGKIARARHNPYAWRIIKKGERIIEQHDCGTDFKYACFSIF